MVETELSKLVKRELITSEESTFPFLGEIPPQDDIPGNQKGGGDEEEEDEDSASGGDESEDGEGRRKSKVRNRTKVKAEEGAKDDDKAAVEAEAKKKHARPPKVFTPLEARIYNILKGMRRPRNQAGELMANAFDRLPDRVVMPGYYEEIKSPMAIDILKASTLYCRPSSS